MSAKNQNIEKLAEAEKKRNEIIDAAKKRKQALQRKAKADAEKEVAEFRKEKAAEYEDYKKAQEGGGDTEKVALVKETQKQLDEMTKLANSRIDKVSDAMVELICTVK
jgi:V-type H+-transporting ATPase subunit G